MAGYPELAGTSERDQAVREFVRDLLVRTPGTRAALPTVLLLGPRGSGKSTLLAHLRQWARRTPTAHLDLAELGRLGAKPIDVLARLVFDLNEKKPDYPRLTFPTFGLLLIAVSSRVDLSSRELAVQQMQAALADSRPRESRGDQLRSVLEGLAETAAAALGAPNWAVAPALRLLPGWEGDWAPLRTRRRLARLRREGEPGPADDFFVTLNRLYNDRERAERRRAEEVLFDAFLTDLEQAYGTRRGDHHRTTQCLVLLDNTESPLGNDFLEALLRAREKSGLRDPLLVLATAAGRPEALVRREPGGVPHPGTYLRCWEKARQFRPVPVDDVLHAGQLRDLYAREVNRIADAVLRRTPPDGAMPVAEDGVEWLGWVVHQLTHGQPAATAMVFDALHDRPPDEPWDVRLRSLFAPDLVAAMLDRLLPFGTSTDLRAMLRRAAAAVNLGQAGAARWLWQDAGHALGGDFARFSGDPLRTMHVTTGDEAADGVHETLHPLLRFLLLRELATEPDGPGDGDAWGAAHTALSVRAASRIQEGHPEEEWIIAYHDLASGHLEAAASYLDSRFGRIPAGHWCAELCRLRRAPVRTPGGGLPGSPRPVFDELVAFLADPERPRSRRMKAVTRLLAASWISPEPRDDPATDHVGDPYRNPLGDPYAELYPDIREELLALRGMVDDGADRHVFLRKSEQYMRRPWW
ncbi:ATP-binding protein [Streptomyces sp. JJ36]|uniref:ATP-binding protein n=1 Tax=Streptomyces sp. JJ36 TaxID=2736645 RepID=UPI001F187DAF|nr:ATP-binding protein [Streptomyces sp. JJ36]MCF6524919.1 ATP-binding protein [Streptomyces sp. JJ36]